MRNTVIGVYDSYSQARNAMNELIASGFDHANIRLNPDQEPAAQELHKVDNRKEEHASGSGIGHFFRSLFGMDEKNEHRDIYTEAVRRGSCLLSVDTDTEEECDRVSEIMHRYDPVDIDERSSVWRSEGWSSANTTSPNQSLHTEHLHDENAMNVPAYPDMAGLKTQGRNVNVFPRTQEVSSYEPMPPTEATPDSTYSSTSRPATDLTQSSYVTEPTDSGRFESHRRTDEDPVIVSSLIVEDLIVNREDFAHDADRMDASRGAAAYRTNTTSASAMDSEKSEEYSGVHPLRQEGDSFIDKSHAVKAENADQSGPEARFEDESDFRSHWQTSYAREGGRYEDYDAAYRYGSSLSGGAYNQNRNWDEVEPVARSNWEMHHPESAWDRVKDAVRYGAERVKGNVPH